MKISTLDRYSFIDYIDYAFGDLKLTANTIENIEDHIRYTLCGKYKVNTLTGKHEASTKTLASRISKLFDK